MLICRKGGGSFVVDAQDYDQGLGIVIRVQCDVLHPLQDHHLTAHPLRLQNYRSGIVARFTRQPLCASLVELLISFALWVN